MILIGEVKFMGCDLVCFLLLPCGATGLSEFDVDSVSLLSVRRGAKVFLGRAPAEQGLSLFLLITNWSIAPVSADLILFRRPGLADSCCWFGYSDLETGSFGGFQEFSLVLNPNDLSLLICALIQHSRSTWKRYLPSRC